MIVLFFFLILPGVIHRINFSYTDDRLLQQKQKIIQIIQNLGIQNYIKNGESYGSYTPLKDEYISLDVSDLKPGKDRIVTEKRIIEQDTVLYRILIHGFGDLKQRYVLEIGKSVSSMREITAPLEHIGLGIMLAMVVVTTVADLFYSSYVLRPLDLIIKTRLLNSSFPQPIKSQPVKTTTSDFNYLDISIQNLMGTIESKFEKEREFISNTSHELLTPISILQSKIENLFSQEKVSHDLKVRLLGMQKIVNRLKATINTFLVISQIENDQFEKQDHVQVLSLIGEVHEELLILVEQKFITWTAEIPPTWVLTRVNQVLLFNMIFNIINNAIKYNRLYGKVTVRAIVRRGLYCLEVEDTGIGIPQDRLPVLFSRSKKKAIPTIEDSYGLGLAIVTTIAKFHHIDIEVSSFEGIGSTFRFVFPTTTQA